MSRTIRRASYTPSHVTSDYKIVNRMIVKVSLIGKERTIAINKYHSDMENTMANSPKWYRQALNRQLRRKQDDKLKACNDDYDNLALPKFVSNDGYYW